MEEIAMPREPSRKAEEERKEHNVQEERAKAATRPDAVRRRAAGAAIRPNGTPVTNGLLLAGAVGVSVAFIEEELLGGVLMSAVAALAPNLLPRLGRALRPVLKEVIRAGYGLVDTTREALAEAGEQVEDIVAEIRSERTAGEPTSAGPAPEPHHA
jgi:Flp pilus assembly protein TadB